MFDTGKEYNTVNGYRSAISAFHPEIDGHNIKLDSILKWWEY